MEVLLAPEQMVLYDMASGCSSVPDLVLAG
jgi:hypothetical protein